MRRASSRTIMVVLMAVILISGGVALLWDSPYPAVLGSHLRRVWAYLQDKEQIRSMTESWGQWGPLFLILFQAIQVVVVPIPGETTTGLVSGFLYGPWLGALYTMVGLTLGSVLGFFLGHWLGDHIINRLISQASRKRLDEMMRHQGGLAALLVFALPYFPKDYFCIGLGMAGMPLKIFLVAVIAGRLPNALLFNLQGAYLYEGNYLSFFLLLSGFLTFAAVVFLCRERLSRLFERLGQSSEEK